MIHQYKSNGYNIVMDINSGSIHVVDDIVYDLIPVVEPMVTEGNRNPEAWKEFAVTRGKLPYSEEEIGEALEELLELTEEGQLFAPDI